MYSAPPLPRTFSMPSSLSAQPVLNSSCASNTRIIFARSGVVGSSLLTLCMTNMQIARSNGPMYLTTPAIVGNDIELAAVVWDLEQTVFRHWTQQVEFSEILSSRRGELADASLVGI